MSKLELSFGNKKLPKSTAILNMGSAHSCPSDKLGLCAVSDICYAKKAEKQYPNVRPYRDRQQAYWLGNTAEDIALDLISKFNRRRTVTRSLRLNEAGDFWSQDCVTKAEELATILKGAGIRTYVYTARRDLDFSECHNLVINGSGFKAAGVNHTFTAWSQAQIDRSTEDFLLCPQDCTKCALCSVPSEKTIVVPMH